MMERRLWSRALPIVLAITLGLIARGAYSMAPMQEASQPAEPDVAFVAPENEGTTSGGCHSGPAQTQGGVQAGSNGISGRVQPGISTNSSVRANSPAYERVQRIVQRILGSRIVRAYSATLYHR